MHTNARSAPTIELPRVDRWLIQGFERHFLPGYLRKHFHVVAANCQAWPPGMLTSQSSLVVYANHASWWDPMLAIYLRSRLMVQHTMYAPIDAEALEQYKVFKRMGFYGIQQNSLRGAAEFLRRSLRIVQSPTASLWLTPEGKFCDARLLDQPLSAGLAHLAHTISHSSPVKSAGDQWAKSVWFVPTALEYVFWEERLPECLCCFGQPIEVAWNSTPSTTKADWNERLTQSLRDAQRTLAAASMNRDTSGFQILLSGKAGSWRVYDWARKSLARLRGQQINLEHHRGLWANVPRL